MAIGKPVALRRQGARARHPRVHLDDDHARRRAGFDGELHVGAAGLDADPPDAGEGGVAHLLVLDVGQRLGRRHGDRVAGVHAHRVEVLDRADDHAVVGPVAHDLELVLLPPGDRALDEDLADGAGVEPGGGDAARTRRRRRRCRCPCRRGCRRGGRSTGRPIALGDGHRPRRGCGRCPTTAPRRPISIMATLNCSRSSAVAMASALAPISSTSVARRARPGRRPAPWPG